VIESLIVIVAALVNGTPWIDSSSEGRPEYEIRSFRWTQVCEIDRLLGRLSEF
jgi:hypothetical protein